MNLFCYAACQLLLILAPDQVDSLLTHLNGSLANSDWLLLQTFGMILLLVMILSCFLMKRIYILSLGEESAKSIGLNFKKYLTMLFAMILLICTCSVAIVGPLLFFPLLAVHCARGLVPCSQPYHFLFISILIGSILLLTCDVLIRSLYPHWEAPLNVFIASIGVPLLILKARKLH
jgi:iron complex transport system permease protein